MRARWLKPEFFNDKKIGKMGPMIGLVYQALWCMADDGGTALCNPEIVKGKMFAFWPMIDLPEISQSLEQLADEKRIERYTIGDDEYAKIVRFDKHQAVHKPSLFRHPPPLQVVTATEDDRLRHGCGTSSANGSTPHILDTYTPKHLTTGGYTPEFDEMWKLYPKRAGGNSKEDAYRQYHARLKSGATLEEIKTGVERYRVYCDSTGKTGTEFVKQMQTFLGRSRHYLETWDIPATNGNHGDENRKRGYLL